MRRVGGPNQVLRHSPRDAWLVAVAAAQGAVLIGVVPLVAALPSAGMLVGALAWAVALWWCSNTVSHIHLHKPLFASRTANRIFGLYLSAATGIPQTIWRERHLWHHAGEPDGPKVRALGTQGWAEIAAVGLTWGALLLIAPRFLALAYAPGYAAGLLLCQLQGHYEHAAPGAPIPAGISCYSPLYNTLWFNDGFHAEHHRWPGAHWTDLPQRRLHDACASKAPPVLRWLAAFGALQPRILGFLEGLAAGFPPLGRFMITTHRDAFARLLAPQGEFDRIKRVTVVGGGLFPRTVLALGDLLPDATFTIIEAHDEHIERARTVLAAAGYASRATFVQRFVTELDADGADLCVLPLAFEGDIDRVIARWRGGLLVTHDWLWGPRSTVSVVVSPVIAKRLSLHRSNEGQVLPLSL